MNRSITQLVAVVWAASAVLPAGAQTLSAGKLDLSDYVTVERAKTTTVAKVSVAAGATGYLGVAVKDEKGTLIVTEVQATSPAGKAGVSAGDVLLRVDGRAATTAAALRDLLQAKSPGASIQLGLERDQKPLDLTITLAATSRPMTVPTGGTTTPRGGKGKGKGFPVPELVLAPWKKESYRLGVIVVEFADVKANEKITPAHWDDAFFSRGVYTKASVTGQPVFGSLHDYFREQSYGTFRLEGKTFSPVQVSKKRGDYAQGSGTSNKTVPLVEAIDKLRSRDGKDALKDFDGLAFIYAGARVNTNRGNLYYPHRGSISLNDQRVPYILVPEGGGTMQPIGLIAIEVGKLLGLPDLAARPENPGSEGLGAWCLMSNGAGDAGKPLHLSAWCKEQLGWIKPTVIDPAVQQKLILSPTLKSPREFLKVLARPDGSEYFLLENRAAHGFDADLPGQGLLVWRVMNRRPSLEEAHGVAGPTGPRVQLPDVPFPSKANSAFTPLTTPSSRALTGGGTPVHITNIQRLPDGRIALSVGYEFN